jgi:hypothetical protein
VALVEVALDMLIDRNVEECSTIEIVQWFVESYNASLLRYICIDQRSNKRL